MTMTTGRSWRLVYTFLYQSLGELVGNMVPNRINFLGLAELCVRRWGVSFMHTPVV